ncbi:hypothetical protein [Dyella mobilis]|uniref:Uncharacterized protein n=1 Tax=Dyella mobilis TaxID=1849582 RepID=A0ABS2KJB4_9GAMM|nr:hypothetical protein [Dyella mobilis]MBM7130990.1 hypothetical protein [Dyella mobilis]
MISKEFTSNYFLNLGWELVDAPDDLKIKRPWVKWLLIPLPSSKERENQFESLGDVWRHWKKSLRRYFLIRRCYELILARYEVADEQERQEIREWVKEKGCTFWRATFHGIEDEAARSVRQIRLNPGWIEQMRDIFRCSPELHWDGFYQVLQTLLSESDIKRERLALDESLPASSCQRVGAQRI